MFIILLSIFNARDFSLSDNFTTNNAQLTQNWRQGCLIELEIQDLSDNGDGVGRWEGRVVFVPNTVVGDRALVRLVRVKRHYGQGKLHQLLETSPHRIRPSCMVADKCGGCQWQHIDYNYQLQAKREQVIQALQRIGKIPQPPVAPVLAVSPLAYRNKATYPLGISATGKVQAGYYRQGSHQLVNLNQCPVQDSRLNPFLAEIKQDIQQRGWSIYNEQNHQGDLRHLSLRIGHHTGEVLLTLVSKSRELANSEEQAKIWLQRYPQLVGVCLNHNPKRTNTIFGNYTHTLAGQSYLQETFAGLKFQLRPETFFQVNTEAAEALLAVIIQQLNLQGKEILLDAYCGIGTFTLPLAAQVKQAIGIEVQSTAVEQARFNAQINQMSNSEFHTGKVENVLPQLNLNPDIVLLDPPRKGCEIKVLETLLKMKPKGIVYVSCKPATLARDLDILCHQGNYQLTFVQPADFFPQTSHVECAAFLNLR